METQKDNQWVLVLGGSSGLGLASAHKMALHGYNIIIVHRDRRSDLPQIELEFKKIKSKGVRLLVFNADGLSLDGRSAIIDEIKNKFLTNDVVKVFVHSVAKGSLKPMKTGGIGGLSNQDFQITTQAMSFSLYDWVRDLVDAKLFDEDARVMSFTSEGSSRVIKNYAAVSAAKSALESITRSIALEFAPLGVKANCIQAGVTLTKSFKMIPGSDKIKKHALERNPNNRLTTPDDVANVVYLLSTDEAKWVTGTVIKVDGGESLR